jgi:uncharacterized membrane protein YdjX (TVP38/TMEM64 family)
MTEAAQPAATRLRRFGPLAFAALALALFFALGGHHYATLDALREHRATLLALAGDHPLLAPLAMVVLYAGLVAISFPGAGYLTIFSGFLFGLWTGFAAAWAGACLGAVAVFLIARTALGDSLTRRAGPSLAKFKAGFEGDAFNYLLALRLVPAFPFWLVNIAPALIGVRLQPYAAATALGIIPGCFIYTWIGASAGEVLDRGEDLSFAIVTQPVILGPILGLIALSLLPVIIKKLRKGQPA